MSEKLNRVKRNNLRKVIGNFPNEINFASINDLLEINLDDVKKNKKYKNGICKCF